jgi:hypothetical protein
MVVASMLLLSTAPIAEAKLTPLRQTERVTLEGYARDTWRSIDAMASEGALPADGLRQEAGGWSRATYTSPTNVAAYLWSTIGAERLGLLAPAEADQRLAATLSALGQLERSAGFFYNWYDAKSGATLRHWPGGGPIEPFLSSVDNGWLAASLMMVAKAHPDLSVQAERLLEPMNFGFFYNAYDAADPSAHPGLLRGGYWPDSARFSAFHYAMLNTEPRITSYVGIARGQLPSEHYFRMARTPSAAKGPLRTYQGVDVHEGNHAYRGLRVVPSWDGTLFEALMVALFVPEADWAERSWGSNHALYVRAQIEHGLHDARHGYWGVSAACDPDGGYHAYGVSALASTSAPVANHSVVTPYASFLALPFAREEALQNLQALTNDFPAYGPYGFFDSVDVANKHVSRQVLILDQAMILAAVTNILSDNALQRIFSTGAVESTIRPLIAQETFSAGIDLVPRFLAEFTDLTSEFSLAHAFDYVPTSAFAAQLLGRGRRPAFEVKP